MLEQSVADWCGLGVRQQQAAVGSNQRSYGNHVSLGLMRGGFHAVQEERRPALPVAIGADGREAAVVLGLVLLEVAAQVQQRLRQQAPCLQQGADQQALFKNDMGAYVRLYAFLSQIFDYGNTAIEKRFLFLKRLIPLLEFGRERDTVDLSKVVLTHHTLKDKGKQPMTLNADGTYKLPPIDATGTGSVQEKQQAYLSEIIEKVNGLFEGELTRDDQLVYVNGVLKGKLLENETLVKQAASNSKEQFANSPDLRDALLHAIMDALEAHSTMSTQALGSQRVRDGLRDVLLGPGQLYEGLRAKSGNPAAPG